MNQGLGLWVWGLGFKGLPLILICVCEGRVQQRQIEGQEHQLAQPQQHHTLSFPVTLWDLAGLSSDGWFRV